MQGTRTRRQADNRGGDRMIARLRLLIRDLFNLRVTRIEARRLLLAKERK